MKNLYLSIILAVLGSSFSALAQVPIYNSLPSAAPVIFLDFDGQTVNGTSWNSAGPIYCGPSNLNDQQITEIFNRVAEDYRPFTINVTTDSTKYWAAPITQRTRIVLTITSAWYGNNAGGVSYVNSFSWGDNTPAFVFTALLNYNIKNISEAVSHEAGHTLGLRHQAAYDANCVKTSDYNYGTGSGEIGWAPIMGVGYYRNYTLWHNGANPYGCTSIQNDLSIITSTTNGLTFRADDYDSSFTKAAALSFTANQFSATGIIAAPNDIDMFSFSMPATGEFQLNAVPYNVGTGDAGSDLDVEVKLYDSAQKLIGIYNPPQTLNVPLDTTLSQGTYYYSVGGSSNQYAPDYASLGSYSLQASYTDLTPLPLRRLKLQGRIENGTTKLNWQIDADEKVMEQVLEASSNGSPFKPITSLDNAARAYSYAAAGGGTSQYRISVTFDNRHQYYSNVIALRNDHTDVWPSLAGNILQGHMVTVNSPSAFSYSITDFSGKVMAQGKLVQGVNSINTGIISNGLYVIRYTNGKEQYVEKFVKQ